MSIATTETEADSNPEAVISYAASALSSCRILSDGAGLSGPLATAWARIRRAIAAPLFRGWTSAQRGYRFDNGRFGFGRCLRCATARLPVPSLARLSILAPALLLGPLVAPPIAFAQTAETLVKNTDQLHGGLNGGNVDFRFDRSLQFTTGGATHGYTLTEVGVQIVTGVSGLLPTFTMEIRADNGSDRPNALVGTLVNPNSYVAGVNTFSAPSGGIKLNPNTKYHLVRDVTAENHRGRK